MRWRKIKRRALRLLCCIFGHKPVTVIENRRRVAGGFHSWEKKYKYVPGRYEECSRCGKKLSGFMRMRRF